MELPNPSALIWVDYCILGLTGISALFGLLRGLIREVFSLTLWGVAVWVGFHYNGAFADLLDPAVPLPSARMAIAFAVLFFGVLMLGGLVSFALGKLISSTGLGGTDRLMGMLFGVARGILIAAVLVFFAGATPLPNDPWWKQSKLIPPLQNLALWLRDQLPPAIAGYVKYR